MPRQRVRDLTSRLWATRSPFRFFPDRIGPWEKPRPALVPGGGRKGDGTGKGSAQPPPRGDRHSGPQAKHLVVNKKALTLDVHVINGLARNCSHITSLG